LKNKVVYEQMHSKIATQRMKHVHSNNSKTKSWNIALK